MGPDSRVIRRPFPNGRNHFLVSRERGYYIVYNSLTGTKRYYARIQDVKAVMRLPVEKSS